MSIFKVTKCNIDLDSSKIDSKSISKEIEHPPISTNYSKLFTINNIIENNQNKSSDVKASSLKRITQFYSQIKLIRKKYNINRSRKNNIDSLVKKSKSKFFKAIYECLKYCLNKIIHKLPQTFIINTKIEFNKMVLNKTLEEIFIEYQLLPSYDVLVQNNMVQTEKQRLLFLLMKSKINNLYECYLLSDFYLREKKRIETKSGIDVAILYDFVATNICEYFLLNKGNRRINNRNSNNHQLIKKILIKKKRQLTMKKSEKNNNNKNSIKFNILKIDDNNKSEKEGKINAL